MAALADRLRERFECGLVTDIRPPDRGTRLTILKKRVAHDGVELADTDAIPAIADRIVDNVRVLEGALIRVVAYSSLTGRPITGDLATEVLGGLYPELVPQRRTIREIQLATCKAFDVEMDDLLSPSRAAGSPGPARSPCTWRASSPTARCRPSATPSAAVTTPP